MEMASRKLIFKTTMKIKEMSQTCIRTFQNTYFVPPTKNVKFTPILYSFICHPGETFWFHALFFCNAMKITGEKSLFKQKLICFKQPELVHIFTCNVDFVEQVLFVFLDEHVKEWFCSATAKKTQQFRGLLILDILCFFWAILFS